jgi:hypothetical protein
MCVCVCVCSGLQWTNYLRNISTAALFDFSSRDVDTLFKDNMKIFGINRIVKT